MGKTKKSRVVRQIAQRLYSIDQAAEYLNMKSETLRRWALSGILPYIRVPGSGSDRGGRILLDVRDLDKFVEQKKRHEVERLQSPKVQTDSRTGWYHQLVLPSRTLLSIINDSERPTYEHALELLLRSEALKEFMSQRARDIELGFRIDRGESYVASVGRTLFYLGWHSRGFVSDDILDELETIAQRLSGGLVDADT